MSSVKDFGAAGDGKTDDTEAIRHALDQGDGVLEFPRGDYLIEDTIEIRLDDVGRLGIDGNEGTATVIMNAWPASSVRTLTIRRFAEPPTPIACDQV